MNFARRVTVPGLYSWGFNDETCPPTSMYAAYNVITAPKRLMLAYDKGHQSTQEQVDDGRSDYSPVASSSLRSTASMNWREREARSWFNRSCFAPAIRRADTYCRFVKARSHRRWSSACRDGNLLNSRG